MDTLQRMIDMTRDRANAVHVLTSSGEFTAAEIAEYLPEVLAEGTTDQLRMGVVQ